MKPAPRASVIVPTFNGASRLRRCLDALLAQRTGRQFEIIVVDDGSQDDSTQVVQCYGQVRLLHQDHRGPAAARNLGVRSARGEIVLFTDDDCVPEPDWLEQMLQPFSTPGVVGAKGVYRTAQKELIARFVQLEYEEKYAHMQGARWIDFVDTYSAAFERQVFLEAGGYDERFSTASTEDQELSFRLASAGHRMVFAPEARVWHTHVDSLRGYLKKKHKIGYWKVYTLLKNPNKIAGDSHTPTTLKIQVLLAAAFLPGLAAVLCPWGWLLPVGIAAGFGLSTLPLWIRCMAADPAVGALAPLFIACRAVGLTSGLCAGLLEFGAGALASRPARL